MRAAAVTGWSTEYADTSELETNLLPHVISAYATHDCNTTQYASAGKACVGTRHARPIASIFESNSPQSAPLQSGQRKLTAAGQLLRARATTSIMQEATM